jgi:hypothetical protein
MWNFTLDWKAGQMFVAHAVTEDQYEPDTNGTLKKLQAARHEVTLLTMDLNLQTQLGVLSWLDVRLMLPLRFVGVKAQFFDKSGEVLKNYNSIHHRNETLVGIGDPSLQVGFRPVPLSQKQRWLVEFGAGVSLPLGRIEKDPNQAGRDGKEPQHIMFGSGTFDPMFFVTAGYIGKITSLTVNGFFRKAFYENIYGLQEGLRFRVSLTGESTFGLETWSFLLRVAYSHQEPGLWSGKLDPDAASGRTDLILTVGVFWRPNNNWQVHCQISVPNTLNIVGGELSHPFILGIGASYRFRLFR